MGRSRDRSRSRRRSDSCGRRQGDSRRRDKAPENDDSEWQEWRDPGLSRRSESRGRRKKEVDTRRERRRDESREAVRSGRSPIRRQRSPMRRESRRGRSPSHRGRSARSPSIKRKRSPSRKKRSPSRKKRSPSRRRSLSRRSSREVLHKRSSSRLVRPSDPSRSKGREPSPARRPQAFRSRSNRERRNLQCERSRSRSDAKPPPPPDEPPIPAPPPDYPPLPESPPKVSSKPANLISFPLSAPLPPDSPPEPVSPPRREDPHERVRHPEKQSSPTNGSFSSMAQAPPMMSADSALVKMFLESHKRMSTESSQPPKMPEPQRMSAESQHAPKMPEPHRQAQMPPVQERPNQFPEITPEAAARAAILAANKPQFQQPTTTFNQQPPQQFNQQTPQQFTQHHAQQPTPQFPPQHAQHSIPQFPPQHMQQPTPQFPPQQMQQPTAQFPPQQMQHHTPQFPSQQMQQHTPQFPLQHMQQHTPHFQPQQQIQQPTPQFAAQQTHQSTQHFSSPNEQQPTQQFTPQFAPQQQQPTPQFAPQQAQQPTTQFAPQEAQRPAEQFAPQQTPHQEAPQRAPADANNSNASSPSAQMSIAELRAQLLQVESYIEEEHSRQQTLIRQSMASGGPVAVKALMAELAPRNEYLQAMKQQIEVSMQEKIGASPQSKQELPTEGPPESMMFNSSSAACKATAPAPYEFAKAPPSEPPHMLQNLAAPNGALPKQLASGMMQSASSIPSANQALGAAFAKGSAPAPQVSAPELSSPRSLRGKYIGKFSHPEFGQREMEIVVEIFSDREGQWTAEGQTEPISVIYQGEYFLMAEKSGMTKLAGQEHQDGVLRGDVIQEGRKGGNFYLVPEKGMAAQNEASEGANTQTWNRYEDPPGDAQNHEKKWDNENKWNDWNDDKIPEKSWGSSNKWDDRDDEKKQEDRWDGEKKWDDEKKSNDESRWDNANKWEDDEHKQDSEKKWDDWENWYDDDDDDNEWENRRYNDVDDVDDDEEEAKEEEADGSKEESTEKKEEKKELQDDEMEVEVDSDPDDWWTEAGRRRKGARKGTGKGKGKKGKKGKKGRTQLDDMEKPEKFDDDHWEEPREKNGLKLLGEEAPEGEKWDYILKDESRRCFAAFRPNTFTKEETNKFFEDIKLGTEWFQPEGTRGAVPRKTAWMVRKGCTCAYRYGGSEVDPQEYPPWMLNLLKIAMPMCGLKTLEEWPDSCNLNLYEDGQMSVGWHADDERIFQGKFTDVAIISISFGQARKFQLRLNFPGEDEKDMYNIMLGNGDMMTMEGMTQKHYMHRVPKEEGGDLEPRINLTWRWILRHTPKCPHARSRKDEDRLQMERECKNLKKPIPEPEKKPARELCGDFKRGDCSRGSNCRYSHGEEDWVETRVEQLRKLFSPMPGFSKLQANPTGSMCFVKFSDHEKASEAKDQANKVGRRAEYARRELDDGEGDNEDGGMCTLACKLEEDKGGGKDKGGGWRREDRGYQDRGYGGRGREELCGDFKRGDCSRGSNCRYSHGEEDSARVSGTFVRSKDTFGFIKMDDGEEIFVLPTACVGYDSVLPILGSRVNLRRGTDDRTGKPKAEDVYPEGKQPPDDSGGSKGSKGSGKQHREERQERRERPKQERQPDDWDCPNKDCGNVVFGRRRHCPRCDAPKPEEASTDRRNDSNADWKEKSNDRHRDSGHQDDDEGSSRPWKRNRDSSQGQDEDASWKKSDDNSENSDRRPWKADHSSWKNGNNEWHKNNNEW